MLHQEHAPSSAPTSEERARDEARRWVRRKRFFYMVLGVFVSLGVMWVAVDLLVESSSFRFYWQLLGTALLVVIGGFVLLGIDGLLGADWERRQIDRHLARRKDRESDTNQGA